MRIFPFFAAACLLAAAQGAYGMTLAELANVSAEFRDMAQKVLYLVETANTRTAQANAEMDAQAKKEESSPEKIRQSFVRIEGHLRAAREDLQKAKAQIYGLGMLYQRHALKGRRGRAAPAPAETEEDKRIAARFNEAYREADTRCDRASERAKVALMQAEERFKALKKAEAPASAPGN